MQLCDGCYNIMQNTSKMLLRKRELLSQFAHMRLPIPLELEEKSTR